MGPGAEDMMTGQAIKALEVSDIHHRIYGLYSTAGGEIPE